MNAKYGYRTKTETFTLLHPSTKKNPDYKDFVAEVETVKNLLAKIEAKKPISKEIHTQVGSILEKWEKEASKISSEDKLLAKLKAAYLENLANVYYHLENLDKANEYANLLVNDKLNKGAGNRVLKRVEKLRKSFNLLSVKTLHFDRKVAADEEIIADEPDMEKMTMEEEVEDMKTIEEETNENYLTAKEKEARNKLLGLHESAREYKGKVESKKGIVHEGIFVVDYSRHKNLTFYGLSNFKFYVNEAEEGEDENWVRMRFSPAKFPKFTINEREFFVVPPKSKLVAASQGISYYILELKETTKRRK